MATPLDMIRDGIETGNWYTVCEGYAALTGQFLNPNASSTNDEVTMFAALETIRRVCDSALSKPVMSDVEPTKTKPSKKKVAAKNVAHKLAQHFADTGQLVNAPPGTKLPGPTDEYAKFNITHNIPAQQIREDGKREAIKLPFEPGMANEFTDDGTIATEDTKFDAKVCLSAPSPRRPPVKLVAVRCSRCNRDTTVNPAAAPRRLSKDDEVGSYVCDSCISRVVK